MQHYSKLRFYGGLGGREDRDRFLLVAEHRIVEFIRLLKELPNGVGPTSEDTFFVTRAAITC
jgi:hypothetical protein